MTLSVFTAAVIVVLLVLVAARKMQLRRASTRTRRHGTVGPAAAGAFYEMLSEDRRKAIEIIVEQKAGYRVAEHPDAVPPEDQ